MPEAVGLSLHKTCQIAQKGLEKGGKPNKRLIYLKIRAKLYKF